MSLFFAVQNIVKRKNVAKSMRKYMKNVASIALNNMKNVAKI